jgi:glycosyltransferase involved in cell wall biosynthesis
LKVAHIVVLTPKRCGLHETARELVAGLRKRGVDSRLVDPAPKTNPIGFNGTEDRGVPVAGMDWAVGADVVVSHSGYDATPLEKTAQPVVHVCHGRPRSTFIGEVMGGTPVYSYHYRLNSDPRIKAVVTFWPEHRAYHEVMFPDKPVHHVQSSVDLEAWSPDGPKGYQFGGKRGRINVVCTDAWRDDVDPFSAVNAFALWAREMKGARLHVYGNSQNLRGWGALFNRIADDGNLGEIKGWVGGLDNVYRAADFMMTPHDIDVRSVRESMACGCPVVRIGAILEGYRARIATAREIDRTYVRIMAEEKFIPETTAMQFHEVLEKL